MSLALVQGGLACVPSDTAPRSRTTPEPVTPVGPPVVKAATKPPPKNTSRWLAAERPDLRRLTVVVRVKPPVELAAEYKKLAKRYPPLSPFLLAHADGSFGSGFVMVLGPGAQNQAGTERVFVVTNQHVVGLADTVKIEFSGRSEQRGASVVYVDKSYDLAVLELAESAASHAKITGGFAIESRPLEDQDAVVASGYPGLADQPSYQVTKGYVSNRRLLLPHDQREQPYIQHTAAIDPGSSGGPLTNDQGKLVGMNTLKVWDREGVGLAVPAEVIFRALDQAARRLEAASPADGSSLLEACNRLLDGLRDVEGTETLERAIGAAMVAEHGAASLAALPSDEPQWERRFVNDPARVFVHAVALRLRQSFPAKEVSGVECSLSEASDAASGQRVVLLGGEQERWLEFGIEQGRYKLIQAPLRRAAKRSFLERHEKRGRKKPWKPSLK